MRKINRVLRVFIFTYTPVHLLRRLTVFPSATMDLDKGPGGGDSGGTNRWIKKNTTQALKEKKGGSWGRGGGLQVMNQGGVLGSMHGSDGLQRKDNNERGASVTGDSKDTLVLKENQASYVMQDGMLKGVADGTEYERSDKDDKNTNTDTNKDIMRPVVVLGADPEQEEGVTIQKAKEDINMMGEVVKENNNMSYGKSAEEYKDIYRDMMLWEEIVKKREEEIAKGWFSKDCHVSNAFLDNAKQNYIKFKKMERDHILSGIIDERNVWEDSDDEDEADEDSVEILKEDEDTEEMEDQNMEDRVVRKRTIVESEIDIEAFSETAGDEVMKESIEGNQGEKRKLMDDDVHELVGREEQEGWTKVVNKKSNPKQGFKSSVKFNAESKPNDVSRETIKMQRQLDNKAEKTTSARRDDRKSANQSNIIENPYGRRRDIIKTGTKTQENNVTNEKQSMGSHSAEGVKKSSLQRTISSYATATKVKTNGNRIRLNFSFNVRVNSVSEWRRVARTILEQSYDVDKKAFIVPWDENKMQGGHGITLEIINNKTTMRDSEIARYFNANGNMIPGKVYYQAGVHITTDLDKDTFIDRWNSNKRDRKENGLGVINIGLANMQNSADSYLIGIAVGSSEDQDTKILNEQLEIVTGVKGIEVSFQNFYQAGLTNEFWDNANKKAKATGAKETSREFLRCKYGWAPSALAIFVPKIHMVGSARKVMIEKYGSLVNGANPQWSDGTRMRFLPIKGGNFKSEKTRAIIKKRIAYHIWMKAHEQVIPTRLVNIHDGHELFEGRSFAQVLMEVKSLSASTTPLFRHFKRMWSNGQTNVTRWSISVHKGLYVEAMARLDTLQQDLVDEYGDRINSFFLDTPSIQRVRQSAFQDEDEDDWVEEDEILPDVEVIEKGFEHFFDDDKSEASWGTSNTKYTEFVGQSTQSTTTSSITHEISQVDKDEIGRRLGMIEDRLLTRYNMDRQNISKVLQYETPYRIVIRAVKDRVWDIDETLDGIYAIYQMQKLAKPPDPSIVVNHE